MGRTISAYSMQLKFLALSQEIASQKSSLRSLRSGRTRRQTRDDITRNDIEKNDKKSFGNTPMRLQAIQNPSHPLPANKALRTYITC
jgi:hypothetical protein